MTCVNMIEIVWPVNVLICICHTNWLAKEGMVNITISGFDILKEIKNIMQLFWVNTLSLTHFKYKEVECLGFEH